MEVHFGDGSNMDQLLNDPDIQLDQGVILIIFSKKNVEAGLTGDALDRLRNLSDNRDFVIRFAGKMMFAFEGYDDDPREICQIPQCVKFMRDVEGEWPYFFWFLDKKSDSMNLFTTLMCDIDLVVSHGGEVGYSPKDYKQILHLLERQENGIQNLIVFHQLSYEEIQTHNEELDESLSRMVQ